MKKLFTVDDFIVAGISGIGYGLSFEIPAILGYEEWQCVVICLIVGFALDKLANAVIFSKAVQSSKANRIIIFLAYILIATAIQEAFISWKNISVDDYAIQGYAFLVVPALLGFAFSMALRQYRIKKIRERYGDGSDGFIFDDLDKSEIDELNQQNRQIHGAFNTDLAVKTKTVLFVGEKRRIQFFSRAFPTPSLLSTPVVGKLQSRCPNRIMCSRQNISARPQYKLITTVQS